MKESTGSQAGDGNRESEEEPIRKVERREAHSGKVSYAKSVVLHESNRFRVEMVPFFVSHKDRTELAVKLLTYQKAPPPNNWQVIDQKSVSLKEAAARKLLRALREHLAVAAEGQDGDYIVIPVTKGAANFSGHDPKTVASALCKALSQEGVIKYLAGLELGSELVSALKGAIRLGDMRTAIAGLRQLLDSGQHDEQHYQKWCEEHSWAFGNAYVMRDEVRNVSPGDKLDMLLPTVISGYREIVELKRPDMEVLLWDGQHKNNYFSAEVSKAIGQCHRYIDVLHEVAAKGLLDHPEIVAYHPRAIIVIGRSADWEAGKARALHGLNHRLSGIVVMTYDQLLAQGERLIEILSEHTYADDADDGEPPDGLETLEDPDDPPF